jgi:hypothetical protein
MLVVLLSMMILLFPHRKNDERDFHGWFKNLHDHQLDLYYLWFDFHSQIDGLTISTAVPAVPIWQMCHSLYSAGFLQFRVSLLGRGGNPSLVRFWENALRLPWGQKHPALLDPTLDTSRLIPLTLHLDGAEIYSNSEFWVLSFASVLATDCNVFDAKFPILKIPHAQIRDPACKRKAIQLMARFVAWCFEILQHGVCPKVGMYGEPLEGVCATLIDQPIMGGYRAACIGFKADLKGRKEANFFKQFYGAIRVCERCRATQAFPSVLRDPAKRRMLFTDMSPDAPWRTSRISHEQYVASCGDVSPWFGVPGLRLEMMYFDIMHIGPLGIFRNLIPGIILDMFQRGELRNFNEELSYRLLWVDFQSWCRSHRIPPPSGTLSRRILGSDARGSKMPELHSCLKATTVKLLVVFLADKVCGMVVEGDMFRETRAACLWAAAEFLHVCDKAWVVLQDHEAGRLEYCGRLFTLSYCSLYDLCLPRRLFAIKPKLHYFDELVIQTVEMRLNPKYVACWGEESFLGKIKRLGLMCSGRTMLTTSMLRYFLHLSMRWEKRRQTNKWYIGG